MDFEALKKLLEEQGVKVDSIEQLKTMFDTLAKRGDPQKDDKKSLMTKEELGIFAASIQGKGKTETEAMLKTLEEGFEAKLQQLKLDTLLDLERKQNDFANIIPVAHKKFDPTKDCLPFAKMGNVLMGGQTKGETVTQGVSNIKTIESIVEKRLDGTKDEAYEHIRNSVAAMKKAMNTEEFGSGGALIPEEFLGSEFIDFVDNQNPLFVNGMRIVDVSEGTGMIPKQLDNPTVKFVSENAVGKDTASQITTGDVRYSTQEENVFVAATHKSLKSPTANMDRIINESILSADHAFVIKKILYGTGNGVDVLGIYNWKDPAGNSVNSVDSGGVALSDIETAMKASLLSMSSVNLNPREDAQLVMNSKTQIALESIRQQNGNRAFEEVLNNNTFFGIPIGQTEAIVVGTQAADESEIFHIRNKDVMFIRNGGMEVTFDMNASYKDADGNQVNGFQDGFAAWKLIRHWDFVVRKRQGVTVIKKVKWA